MKHASSSTMDNTDKNIDREVEFILKEYEAMRNEVVSREASRAQITSVTIILIGGVTAIIPFLNLPGSQDLQLRIPVSILIFILLVVSFLFTSLMYTYLLHDLEVTHIANYIKILRARACHLLKLEKETALIFSWDIYHTRRIYHGSKFATPGVLVLTFSRYAIMFIPAIISVGLAGWLYGNQFSIPPINTVEWLLFIGLGLDIMYFIVVLIISIHAQVIFRDLVTISK